MPRSTPSPVSPAWPLSLLRSVGPHPVTALALTLLLAGCAGMDPNAMTPTQRRSAIGAGVGAVAGAALGGDARSAAIGAGVGALGGYVWSRQMEQTRQTMERATVGTGVAVTQTPDNQLRLDIPSDISFDTGRADIKPNLRPVLDSFARPAGAAAHRGAHHRSHRQHRLRRIQRAAFAAARTGHPRLPDRARRGPAPGHGGRTRRARAGGRQRLRGGSRPQPARRDLPGRTGHNRGALRGGSPR